jgi:hypothetical protein
VLYISSATTIRNIASGSQGVTQMASTPSSSAARPTTTSRSAYLLSVSKKKITLYQITKIHEPLSPPHSSLPLITLIFVNIPVLLQAGRHTENEVSKL